MFNQLGDVIEVSQAGCSNDVHLKARVIDEGIIVVRPEGVHSDDDEDGLEERRNVDELMEWRRTTNDDEGDDDNDSTCQLKRREDTKRKPSSVTVFIQRPYLVTSKVRERKSKVLSLFQ